MPARKTKALTPVMTADDAYWRDTHADREYVLTDLDFDTDYLPAYRFGTRMADRADGRTFDEVAGEAERDWSRTAGDSRLSWPQALPAVQDAYDRVIQLREEQLKVDKQSVKAGEVKVRKEVKTERKSVNVPVEREEVVIERRAVNRKAAGAKIAAEEVRIPVSEEKVRVSKETVVKEEVKVGKKKVAGSKTVGADVRREELVVENEGQARVRQTTRRGKK